MALQVTSCRNEHAQTSMTLEGHKGHVTSLAISPQKLLASSCTEGTVQLWNVLLANEAQSHATLNVGCGVSATSFCDNWVALVGGDGRLHMFDVVSGAHRKVLQRSSGDSNILNDVFCSDDVIAFGGDSGRVFFCDPRSRQVIREAYCGAPVTAIAGEGHRWYCGLADGTVREIDDGGHTTILYAHSSVVSGIVAVEGTLASRDVNGAVRVWCTKPFVIDQSRLVVHKAPEVPFACPLLARIAASPSGLFLGHGNGSCELLDFNGDRRWLRRNVHEGAVTKVLEICEGYIASSGWDGRVTILST
jgi:hypothetical protein